MLDLVARTLSLEEGGCPVKSLVSWDNGLLSLMTNAALHTAQCGQLIVNPEVALDWPRTKKSKPAVRMATVNGLRKTPNQERHWPPHPTALLTMALLSSQYILATEPNRRTPKNSRRLGANSRNVARHIDRPFARPGKN